MFSAESVTVLTYLRASRLRMAEMECAPVTVRAETYAGTGLWKMEFLDERIGRHMAALASAMPACAGRMRVFRRIGDVKTVRSLRITECADTVTRFIQILLIGSRHPYAMESTTFASAIHNPKAIFVILVPAMEITGIVNYSAMVVTAYTATGILQRHVVVLGAFANRF